MSFARDQYTASAAQTDFTISYPYQAEEDVVVTVDGVLQVQGAGSDYTFSNSTTIQFNSGLVGAENVVLTRSTSQNTRDVNFTAGPLTETDLDNSALQVFYMAQEAIDVATLSMLKGSDNKWDAQSLVMRDVADPVQAGDAATKNYVDSVALGSFPSPLALGSGGTGATTAAGARTALQLGGKHNLVATTDPGVSDDGVAGYSVGSEWLNVTADVSWACLDSSTGAAVWFQTSSPVTTRGDMEYRGAASMSRLAVGSSTQILGSDGTDPAWVTKEGWEHVVTSATGTGATLDFETGFDAGFEHLFIHHKVFPAVADFLCFRVKEAGAYITGATDYRQQFIRGANTAVVGASSNSSFVFVGASANVAAAADGISGHSYFMDAASASVQTSVSSNVHGSVTTADTGLYVSIVGGHREAAAACQGVRFLWLSANNFGGGTITHMRRNVT
jgi:hypothetical protein